MIISLTTLIIKDSDLKSLLKSFKEWHWGMEFHNNPADGIFSIFPPLSYSLFPPPFLCISVYYTPKFPPNLAFIFLKIHPQTTLASFHFLSCADIFLWKTCYLHVHIFLIYLSPTCSIQKNNASLIQQKKYIFSQFGHKIQARFSARFITSIPCLTSGTDPSPLPLCSRLPKRTLAYRTATLVYCFKTRDF